MRASILIFALLPLTAVAQTPAGKQKVPAAAPAAPVAAPATPPPPPPPPPLAQTPVAPPGPRLTLAQVLAAAAQHNPRILQARADIAQRVASVAAARSNLDTALTVGVDVGLARVPVPASLGDGAADDIGFGGSVGYLHRFEPGTTVGVNLAHRYANSVQGVLTPGFNTDLRVTATQPLLRGLGSEVNLADHASAKLQVDAARLDLRRTTEQVLAQVAVAYWSVVQAQEDVSILKRTSERAEQVAGLTQEMIKRGALPQSASVQAASTRSLRKARLQAAERILEAAQATLIRSVLDQTPVRISAADALPTPTPPPAEAPLDRVDVKAAEIRVDALAVQVKAFDDRARPALDLALFAGVQGLGGSVAPGVCTAMAGIPAPAVCRDDPSFDGYGSAWNLFQGLYTAGLSATLELPIVNEGLEGQADVARAAVERAKADVDAVRRDAEAEAASLRELAMRDRRAFETAEEARAVTLQLIDVEEQKYKVGSATTFDVLRVQDDLAEAESLANAAKAAVAISDIQYQLATGHVLDHLGVQAPE